MIFTYTDYTSNRFYKFCDKSDSGTTALKKEFDAMTKIASKEPETYKKYFPHYSECGIADNVNTPSKIPNGYFYISMERINFNTLEEYLVTKKPHNKVSDSPTMLFNNDLFRSIHTNVYNAIMFLHHYNILYLDLNPNNILIDIDSQTNELKSLKLVDFTGVYYLDKPNNTYKLIDNQIQRNWPLNLQFKYALMLFCTRLCYYGSEDYNRFSLSNHIAGKFFEDNFNFRFCDLITTEDDRKRQIEYARKNNIQKQGAAYLLTEWYRYF